jgi:hypothetical protein
MKNVRSFLNVFSYTELNLEYLFSLTFIKHVRGPDKSVGHVAFGPQAVVWTPVV